MFEKASTHLQHYDPEEKDESDIWIFENVERSRNDGYCSVNEEIYAERIQPHNEKQLRRNAVAVKTSQTYLIFHIEFLRFSNPESRSFLKPFQHFPKLEFIVSIEIQFEHVENDDDVDLKEKSKDDRAEQV